MVRARGQKRGKGGMERRGKRRGKADKWKAGQRRGVGPWIQASRHVTGRHRAGRGHKVPDFMYLGLADEEIGLGPQRTKHYWLWSRACC